MYCGHCGKKISYNAAYCRFCGQRLKHELSDTQPMTVVDVASISDQSVNHYGTNYLPRRSNLALNSMFLRPKLWRTVFRIIAVAVLITLTFVLVTFKSVEEYRILTAALGSILILYYWWKAR
ncbi:MAG TPA: zinc ribbon domain-containing protein [Methylomusa anaerophila]|uniref:Zinc-ribbon domain-containing protein n=1 Tax=Methylomusa anaerophila TaxID=1930071 RepID=A0A348AFV3_9FIRM|nr:zinc ribbon domain-containing protein [Methylomusa anaerophila]BBB89951.1 hypothetical protein MAMMFC1_00591 [Methylomusa anaerophila]HML88322.1 zinc ribbon domain-containing protein [Methylomusa anaerophila]